VTTQLLDRSIKLATNSAIDCLPSNVKPKKPEGQSTAEPAAEQKKREMKLVKQQKEEEEIEKKNNEKRKLGEEKKKKKEEQGEKKKMTKGDKSKENKALNKLKKEETKKKKEEDKKKKEEEEKKSTKVTPWSVSVSTFYYVVGILLKRKDLMGLGPVFSNEAYQELQTELNTIDTIQIENHEDHSKLKLYKIISSFLEYKMDGTGYKISVFVAIVAMLLHYTITFTASYLVNSRAIWPIVPISMIPTRGILAYLHWALY
jgi:hypothetical protein